MTGSLAVRLVMLSSTLGLIACGGPVVSTPTDPVLQSLQRSESAVDRALESARDEADDQDLIAFRARYNPALACECPAWEIELRGRWTRVFLETAEEALVDVEDVEAQARDELESGRPVVWVARGRLGEDWQRDEVSGMEYPVLSLVLIEPAE